MKPLYARQDDTLRGRHLVATQNISKNELLFVERPLLSLQSIGNAHQGALCCRFCRAFVGGPDLALMVASGKVRREEVWEYYRNHLQIHEREETKTNGRLSLGDNYKMHPCRNNCGEIFCSVECEEKMWSCGGHDLMCTGLIPDPEEDTTEEDESSHASLHPLLQFKLHAVRSNEIFLMVADLVASVVSLRRQQIALNLNMVKNENQMSWIEEVTLEELMEPYLDFTLEPWWEVATEPIISDPNKLQECIELNMTLRELCSTSAKLLHDAFTSTDGDEEFQNTLVLAMDECQKQYQLFSGDFFGKVIGSFEQNAIGIRARHPLCRDVLEDSELRRRRHEELVQCISLAGMMGGEQDEGDSCNQGQQDEEGEEISDQNNDDDDDDQNSSVDGHDYTVDDIASFLSELYVDEQGISSSELKSGTIENDCKVNEQDGDDLDLLFTPLDGTCMLSTTCKMNHSCEPNVVARFSYSCSSGGNLARWGKDFPLVVQCVALRDISEGEELCISYITNSASLLERQKELLHYGFRCQCDKCQREGLACETNALESGYLDGTEYDMFGDCDDHESIENEDKDDDCDADANHVDNDCDGEVKLLLRCKQLDKILGMNKVGDISLSILGPALSFVNKLGSQIARDMSVPDSVEENAVMKQLVENAIKELSNKNISDFKNIAISGERLSMSIFQKSGGWPTLLDREVHSFFCVASAICHARDGNFLPAIQLLDKALIFGLSREVLERFYKYVEHHSLEISSIHNENCRVPRVCIYDYSMMDIQQEILEKGVDASIQHPIAEICADEAEECTLGTKPVVIRQYASNWPALQKWRHLNYFLRNYGNRLVPIEHGCMYDGNGMTEELMSIDNFVLRHLCTTANEVLRPLVPGHSSGSVAYLAQHRLINQLPDLTKDIILPRCFGGFEPTEINAWIGTGGTRTPLHFDSYENMFVQVVGAKYVRLYDYSEKSKLYVIKNDKVSYARQGNMSAVNCEKEDYVLHPDAKNAKYTEVILFPGDVLYIPAKTWHYVRSLSISFSVNFWW